MSILVGSETKLIVQGITGKEGSFHASQCLSYGTNIIAGVTPGKAGQLFDNRVPVFDSVNEAVQATDANTSLIFVPPPFVADAIIEAADSKIELIVVITEGVPVLDTSRVIKYLKGKPSRVLGPNCPGLISPRSNCKVGIMPSAIYKPGQVGVVSRSGTLTYEAVSQLSKLDIGQSSCVGIGGDPIIGTSFIDVLRLFKDDPETEIVVLIGEIGGTMEQEAATYIHDEFNKPVVALIVGATAPPGKRMGHAGAIITGDSAQASAKIKALSNAGVTMVSSPAEIGTTVETVLLSRYGGG